MSVEIKKHAPFSCSGSKRWVNCSASHALSKQAPEASESDHAKSGTETHACLEYLGRGKGSVAAVSHCQKKWGSEVTARALSALREIERRTTPGSLVLFETEADLRYIDKDFWGTFDASIIEHFGRLTVIDYKDGFQPVEPKDNEQGLSYALALSHKYDHNFKEICIVIIQPNCPHEQGPVREWVTSVKKLLEWEEIFRKGIVKAKAIEKLVRPGWETNSELLKKMQAKIKDAPFKADDAAFGWCKWCPAAVICPELSTKALKGARIAFAPESAALSLPAPQEIGALAPQNLGRTLSACNKIKTWISEVEKHAYRVLEKGQKVEGWKLVPRRATRYWTDVTKVEKEAAKKFDIDAFAPRELLSPAQMEKVAGKKWVNARTSNVSSGLTLVPESDKRKGTNGLKLAFGGKSGDGK